MEQLISLNESAIRPLRRRRRSGSRDARAAERSLHPARVRRSRHPTDSSVACRSTEEGVAAAPEARSFNDIAALFKNFDLSVQSRIRVPSLLFDSHHGDYRCADIWRRR